MTVWAWLGFAALIVLFLALDLGVFHRKAHVVSVREALAWTVVWAALRMASGAFVYFGYERHWVGLGLLPPGAGGAGGRAAARGAGHRLRRQAGERSRPTTRTGCSTAPRHSPST